MKYSKSAIGLLTAQYRSVLKKCWMINVGLFALGGALLTATPAEAEHFTVSTDGSLYSSGTATAGSKVELWSTSSNIGYVDLSASDIITLLSTNAVQRATADSAGNNIINTYATQAALNDYLLSETAGNTYETIANVNALKNGNTQFNAVNIKGMQLTSNGSTLSVPGSVSLTTSGATLNLGSAVLGSDGTKVYGQNMRVDNLYFGTAETAMTGVDTTVTSGNNTKLITSGAVATAITNATNTATGYTYSGTLPEGVTTNIYAGIDKVSAALDAVGNSAMDSAAKIAVLNDADTNTKSVSGKIKTALTTERAAGEVASGNTSLVTGGKVYSAINTAQGTLQDQINTLNDGATVTGSVAQKISKAFEDNSTTNITSTGTDAAKLATSGAVAAKITEAKTEAGKYTSATGMQVAGKIFEGKTTFTAAMDEAGKQIEGNASKLSTLMGSDTTNSIEQRISAQADAAEHTKTNASKTTIGAAINANEQAITKLNDAKNATGSVSYKIDQEAAYATYNASADDYTAGTIGKAIQKNAADITANSGKLAGLELSDGTKPTDITVQAAIDSARKGLSNKQLNIGENASEVRLGKADGSASFTGLSVDNATKAISLKSQGSTKITGMDIANNGNINLGVTSSDTLHGIEISNNGNTVTFKGTASTDVASITDGVLTAKSATLSGLKMGDNTASKISSAAAISSEGTNDTLATTSAVYNTVKGVSDTLASYATKAEVHGSADVTAVNLGEQAKTVNVGADAGVAISNDTAKSAELKVKTGEGLKNAVTVSGTDIKIGHVDGSSFDGLSYTKTNGVVIGSGANTVTAKAGALTATGAIKGASVEGATLKATAATAGLTLNGTTADSIDNTGTAPTSSTKSGTILASTATVYNAMEAAKTAATTYDPSASILTKTTVQEAIDEAAGKIAANKTNIAANTTKLDGLKKYDGTTAANTVQEALADFKTKSQAYTLDNIKTGAQNANYDAGTYDPGTIGAAIKANADAIAGLGDASKLGVATTMPVDADHIEDWATTNAAKVANIGTTFGVFSMKLADVQADLMDGAQNVSSIANSLATAQQKTDDASLHDVIASIATEAGDAVYVAKTDLTPANGQVVLGKDSTAFTEKGTSFTVDTATSKVSAKVFKPSAGSGDVTKTTSFELSNDGFKVTSQEGDSADAAKTVTIADGVVSAAGLKLGANDVTSIDAGAALDIITDVADADKKVMATDAAVKATVKALAEGAVAKNTARFGAGANLPAFADNQTVADYLEANAKNAKYDDNQTIAAAIANAKGAADTLRTDLATANKGNLVHGSNIIDGSITHNKIGEGQVFYDNLSPGVKNKIDYSENGVKTLNAADTEAGSVKNSVKTLAEKADYTQGESTITIAEGIANAQSAADSKTISKATQDFDHGVSAEVATIKDGNDEHTAQVLTVAGAKTIFDAKQDWLDGFTGISSKVAPEAAFREVFSNNSNIWEDKDASEESHPTTIAGALKNIDSNLGTIHGLATKLGQNYKGNLASGSSVEDHLTALDTSIGNRAQYIRSHYANTTAEAIDNATAIANMDSAIFDAISGIQSDYVTKEYFNNGDDTNKAISMGSGAKNIVIGHTSTDDTLDNGTTLTVDNETGKITAKVFTGTDGTNPKETATLEMSKDGAKVTSGDKNVTIDEGNVIADAKVSAKNLAATDDVVVGTDGTAPYSKIEKGAATFAGATKTVSIADGAITAGGDVTGANFVTAGNVTADGTAWAKTSLKLGAAGSEATAIDNAGTVMTAAPTDDGKTLASTLTVYNNIHDATTVEAATNGNYAGGSVKNAVASIDKNMGNLAWYNKTHYANTGTTKASLAAAIKNLDTNVYAKVGAVDFADTMHYVSSADTDLTKAIKSMDTNVFNAIGGLDNKYVSKAYFSGGDANNLIWMGDAASDIRIGTKKTVGTTDSLNSGVEVLADATNGDSVTIKASGATASTGITVKAGDGTAAHPAAIEIGTVGTDFTGIQVTNNGKDVTFKGTNKDVTIVDGEVTAEKATVKTLAFTDGATNPTITTATSVDNTGKDVLAAGVTASGEELASTLTVKNTVEGAVKVVAAPNGNYTAGTVKTAVADIDAAIGNRDYAEGTPYLHDNESVATSLTTLAGAIDGVAKDYVKTSYFNNGDGNGLISMGSGATTIQMGKVDATSGLNGIIINNSADDKTIKIGNNTSNVTVDGGDLTATGEVKAASFKIGEKEVTSIDAGAALNYSADAADADKKVMATDATVINTVKALADGEVAINTANIAKNTARFGAGAHLPEFADNQTVADYLEANGAKAQYKNGNTIADVFDAITKYDNGDILIYNNVTGTNGKALIFNEKDGGGAKFEHTDGTWSAVAVNDGGATGIAAQIYAVNNGTKKGTRLNVTTNGMFYTNGATSAAYEAIDELVTLRTAENAVYTPGTDAVATKDAETVNGAIMALDGAVDANAKEIAKRKITISKATVGNTDEVELATIEDGTAEDTAVVLTLDGATKIFEAKQGWMDSVFGIDSKSRTPYATAFNGAKNINLEGVTMTSSIMDLDGAIADRKLYNNTHYANPNSAADANPISLSQAIKNIDDNVFAKVGTVDLSGATNYANTTATPADNLTEAVVNIDSNVKKAIDDLDGKFVTKAYFSGGEQDTTSPNAGRIIMGDTANKITIGRTATSADVTNLTNGIEIDATTGNVVMGKQSITNNVASLETGVKVNAKDGKVEIVSVDTTQNSTNGVSVDKDSVKIGTTSNGKFEGISIQDGVVTNTNKDNPGMASAMSSAGFNAVNGAMSSSMAADGVAVNNGDKKTTVTADSVAVTNGTKSSSMAADGLAVENGNQKTTVAADGVKVAEGENKYTTTTAAGVSVKDGNNTADLTAAALTMDDTDNKTTVKADGMTVENAEAGTKTTVASGSIEVKDADGTTKITGAGVETGSLKLGTSTQVATAISDGSAVADYEPGTDAEKTAKATLATNATVKATVDSVVSDIEKQIHGDKDHPETPVTIGEYANNTIIGKVSTDTAKPLNTDINVDTKNNKITLETKDISTDKQTSTGIELDNAKQTIDITSANGKLGTETGLKITNEGADDQHLIELTYTHKGQDDKVDTERGLVMDADNQTYSLGSTDVAGKTFSGLNMDAAGNTYALGKGTVDDQGKLTLDYGMTMDAEHGVTTFADKDGNGVTMNKGDMTVTDSATVGSVDAQGVLSGVKLDKDGNAQASASATVGQVKADGSLDGNGVQMKNDGSAKFSATEGAVTVEKGGVIADNNVTVGDKSGANYIDMAKQTDGSLKATFASADGNVEIAGGNVTADNKVTAKDIEAKNSIYVGDPAGEIAALYKTGLVAVKDADNQATYGSGGMWAKAASDVATLGGTGLRVSEFDDSDPAKEIVAAGISKTGAYAEKGDQKASYSYDGIWIANTAAKHANLNEAGLGLVDGTKNASYGINGLYVTDGTDSSSVGPSGIHTTKDMYAEGAINGKDLVARESFTLAGTTVHAIDDSNAKINDFSGAGHDVDTLATTSSIYYNAEDSLYTPQQGTYTTVDATTINEALTAVDNIIGNFPDGLNYDNHNLDNGGQAKPENIVDAFNNIDATLGQIHGLAAKLESEGTYMGNLAEGTTVENHLTALDASIGNRRAYTQQNVIKNNESTAKSLDALDMAVGDISKLQGTTYASADNLSDAVVQIDDKLQNLDGRMERAEKDLKDVHHELRRGMASMAAMSALVPNSRSTGKTSLSLGTGAYSGHNAVAVGGFHYLTDNLMLNAGAAWSNSRDAVYRVGVTYSF